MNTSTESTFEVSVSKALSVSALYAFSLIELLVVVGIIGVLAALILASVSAANTRAKRIQCANNVRQLGLGIQLFVLDNHVYPLGDNAAFEAGIDTEHMGDWRKALEKEFPRLNVRQTKDVWHCPAFHPPSSQDDRVAYGWNSYGYNSFGIEPAFLQDYLGLGGHKGAQARSYRTPVRESEVVNSSEMMALGDGFFGGFFPQLYINDGSRFLGRTRAVAEVGGVNGPYKDKPGSTARAKSRHKGRGNVVFCDGHVESPTLEMLFVSMGEADLSGWNRDHQPHLDRLEHR